MEALTTTAELNKRSEGACSLRDKKVQPLEERQEDHWIEHLTSHVNGELRQGHSAVKRNDF